MIERTENNEIKVTIQTDDGAGVLYLCAQHEWIGACKKGANNE